MSKRFKQLEDTFNIESTVLDNETEQFEENLSDLLPAEMPPTLPVGLIVAEASITAG